MSSSDQSTQPPSKESTNSSPVIKNNNKTTNNNDEILPQYPSPRNSPRNFLKLDLGWFYNKKKSDNDASKHNTRSPTTSDKRTSTKKPPMNTLM